MKKIAWLLATPFLVSSAYATDLLQAYRAAQENDSVFAAARATRDAGQEKLPQGRAALLPSLSLSGNTVWNENEISTHNGPTLSKPSYNSNAYQLTLTQPLFRWQNWIGYDQASLQAAQSEANYAQARQDLILRVAQAYFDVLNASENLSAVRANKQAISQQLALAKASFEVGSATITDTHEAQARFDLASAQEIAALSDLEVKQQTLRIITGQDSGPLSVPGKNAVLPMPQPADIQSWIAAAEKDSINVQVQQAAADIAEREVDKQRAGHLPTVDLVANYGQSKSFVSTFGVIDTQYQNAGVQLNIPLFQGGLTVSRQREAAANRLAARSALEASKRNAGLAARQYYLGVANGLAQLKALQAALLSSQSALESNKLGYEVGVRINIDVLNAENQVYVTRRDLAKATFDTLMAQLRLKAAVGTLGEDDVAQINALLEAPAAQ